MSSSNPKAYYLWRKIIFRSAKLPALYLLIGGILVALSYIDNVFALPALREQFNIADRIGSTFIVIALVTFLYKLIGYICRWYERKLSRDHKVASVILTSLRKSLRIIYLLIVINIIITFSEPQRFYLIFANNVINTAIIASIGWIAIQVLYTFEAVVYQHMMTLTKEKHIRVKALYTKTRILRNIATFLIVIITIAAILMSFSSVKNIGISLLASAGFITAIIGLSAQKSLISLFSGLQIALSHTLKIGDMVVIEKETGLIEEITFTHVTLKLGDRRRLVVPISYFSERAFENWSREHDSMRCSLHFHVDYQMPIAPIREELDRILSASKFWDKQAKKVQVANIGERDVEIRVQVSAENADDLADLRAEVREKILLFMQDHYADFFPKSRSISQTNNTECDE